MLAVFACSRRTTAQGVAMMRKCGSRHTAISPSISAHGFNYFADAHAVPSVLTKDADFCGSCRAASGNQTYVFNYLILLHYIFFMQ